jgi:hypothetical protein
MGNSAGALSLAQCLTGQSGSARRDRARKRAANLAALPLHGLCNAMHEFGCVVHEFGRANSQVDLYS